ncbi:MAG: helix-turn-helix domain-containing protein [Candidatus Gastranaerophilaceae bacterium]
MTIGNRLRIFRKELNLSAKDMSALAGVALRTYGGYERDEITISPKLIMFLFSDYKLNIHWLYTGIGQMFYSEKNTLKLKYEPLKYDSFAFGKRLNKIRIHADMITREISMLLEIKEDRFTDLCIGKTLPTIDEITKICENFDVSADWLLFGIE